MLIGVWFGVYNIKGIFVNWNGDLFIVLFLFIFLVGEYCFLILIGGI